MQLERHSSLKNIFQLVSLAKLSRIFSFKTNPPFCYYLIRSEPGHATIYLHDSVGLSCTISQLFT